MFSPARELYLSATQKIPRAMLVRFFERHNDSECDIEKFSDWLVERLARLKRVDQWLFGFGQDSSTRVTRREEPRAAQGRVTRTFTTEAAASPTTTQSVCFKCHGSHPLEDCAQFKALPMWERWRFVSLVSFFPSAFKWVIGPRTAKRQDAGSATRGIIRFFTQLRSRPIIHVETADHSSRLNVLRPRHPLRHQQRRRLITLMRGGPRSYLHLQ